MSNVQLDSFLMTRVEGRIVVFLEVRLKKPTYRNVSLTILNSTNPNMLGKIQLPNFQLVNSLEKATKYLDSIDLTALNNVLDELNRQLGQLGQ